eukprot:4617492-Pleurochrysis_carterae.AAC.1
MAVYPLRVLRKSLHSSSERRAIRSIYTILGGFERGLVFLDLAGKRERPYDDRLVPRRLTNTRTERLRVDLAWGRPAEGAASKLSDSTIAALAPKALAGCPSHPLQT